MEKFKLYFVNTKGEYFDSFTPIHVTADKSKAYSIPADTSMVDETFVEDFILKNLETIVNDSTFSTTTLVFEDEAGIEVIQIEFDFNGGIVAIGTLKGATVSSDLKNCAMFIKTCCAAGLGDIMIRKLMSPESLSKTISEAVSKVTGMPTATSISKEDDIDDVVNKISETTKAEVVKPSETLADYVCTDLLKSELIEITDFFQNRTVYRDANIQIPKGILFKGPWGSGKTYAARCIAGSVDCYFMTCTASSLQGMYIGSGAENIRNVFKGARTLAEKSGKGVILFIDELDSLGDRRHRDGGASGEEDRTLNQLLAEMSGFKDDDNVMILAATNFPERLDSALMRSGRFGRQITIGYPEEQERINLVQYYFGKLKLPISKETNVPEIANLCQGLTPADIKEISNEAAILTIRHKDKEILLEHINEAINKVITKNIRQNDPDTYDELRLITAHECGHVVAELAYNCTVPIKVTNYAYGDAGGFTQSAEMFSGILPQDRFINEIKILLGGRAAEEICCHYITNGASNDLEKAKSLLYAYYETYNFEKYEVKDLDQIVLDKLNQLYTEVKYDFDSKLKDCLNELIEALLSKRVLYTSDIAGIASSYKEAGIRVC